MAETRLRLVPLTAGSIGSLALRPDEPLSQDGLTGLVWPADDRRVIEYRSAALATDPTSERWLLSAVLDADGTLMGRIGCHSAPVDGRVEVGYSVRPEHRG
jgi:hypothetical protein